MFVSECWCKTFSLLIMNILKVGYFERMVFFLGCNLLFAGWANIEIFSCLSLKVHLLRQRNVLLSTQQDINLTFQRLAFKLLDMRCHSKNQCKQNYYGQRQTDQQNICKRSHSSLLSRCRRQGPPFPSWPPQWLLEENPAKTWHQSVSGILGGAAREPSGGVWNGRMRHLFQLLYYCSNVYLCSASSLAMSSLYFEFWIATISLSL